MDKKLKIGIIHYSCPPVVGGVEELLKQHAIIFHRFGHHVHVFAGMGGQFTQDFPVTINSLFSSNNPRVKRANDAAREGNYRSMNILSNEILEALDDWGCNLDIIIAHNVLQMPFNLALTMALRKFAAHNPKVPIVSWAHDSPYVQEEVPEYLFRSPWTVLRNPHKNIKHVTISASRKRLLEKYLNNTHWTIIPNGIDATSFLYLDSRSIKLARELKLFQRDLVIVQPSRITPRKNLELSLGIINGLKQLGMNVLFALTGAYDPHEKRAIGYYKRLTELICELDLKENVAILAEYRFKDGTKLVPERNFIRDLYLMADLLLMTSRDEGFGLPLIEAGIIKLPIACTDIPPFIEIGEDVCFFKSTDPSLYIAGRILEYLSRTNTHRMFRKVMTNYELENVCEKKILPFLKTIYVCSKK